MSGDAVGCSGHQGPDGAAIRRTEERGVGRQPTMEDVARECGVSRALVSIVFRRAPGASERTRARVLEAAERIGYRHNLIAARLASMSTRTFGVFIFDMRNALTADVFDGIQAEADSRGIGLVTGVSDPGGERDERTMRELHAARVDAVLLVSAAMPGDRLRELSGSVPTVSLTRRVDGLDSVVGDDRAGGRMLTEHLLSLGHKRIAMLGPTWSPSDRVLGHEEAMRAAGLAPEVVAIGYDADAVARATRELLGRPAGERPTAIMAHNDIAAYTVLDVVDSLGLAVPGDVAVTGYDNLRTSAGRRMDLTSADQHAHELGRRGVEAACARLEDPDGEPTTSVLAPDLVVRGSSGA